MSRSLISKSVYQDLIYSMFSSSFYSLPQEDSDYERERTPPTPPPRKSSRRANTFKLACIGKQESDENPLMRRNAAPLKLAQAQV